MPWEVGRMLLQVQWVPRDAGEIEPVVTELTPGDEVYFMCYQSIFNPPLTNYYRVMIQATPILILRIRVLPPHPNIVQSVLLMIMAMW
jgi:hypothetical protein